MELTYSEYEARQRQELSLGGLEARAEKLAPAGRFDFRGGSWEPAPYCGYAVVTMVDDRPEHRPLLETVERIQEQLARIVAEPGSLFSLPRSSFHQTIANTLSAERYREHVVEKGLESDYPSRITSAFGEFPSPHGSPPVVMQMRGLAIFGQALGLLGTFSTESEFQRILRFRDWFYGAPAITELEVRRTRPFIGHITVAYLERSLALDERRRLASSVDGINQALGAEPPVFHLERAELRAYSHLAEFHALAALPMVRL